jgi:M6 family metalloprotease-like protein
VKFMSGKKIIDRSIKPGGLSEILGSHKIHSVGELVRFTMPNEKLYLGSFIRIPVNIEPASGLTIDDLTFIVPAGPEGGLISASRDNTFDPKKPGVMLCLGYKPGIYEMHAIVTATQKVVGKSKFTVTDMWTDDRNGPPMWVTGILKGHTAGATWGGGDPGPQNYNIIPASGNRRVLIMLVDTKTQRFTTNASDLQAIRDRWQDNLEHGVTEHGLQHSANLYYKEVSYSNFGISATVTGPVNLSGEWDDYFTLEKNSTTDYDPKGEFDQMCISAAGSTPDWDNVDSILFVVQEVDATTTSNQKRVWPQGWGGTYTTSKGDKNYAVIAMPHNWGLPDATTGVVWKAVYECSSHELGHNLGMADDYKPDVPGRMTQGWDLMEDEDPLPHMTLAQRLMLGWVKNTWVKAYDFSTMPVPVDETVTLHPIEQGQPPQNRWSGVEVRLESGWNYYFEYRVGQAGQIGDGQLPKNDCIIGTDVISSNHFTPPSARPPILMLPGGGVFGNNDTFQQTIYVDGVPTDLFDVSVSGIDGKKADLRIKYGLTGKPDPSIRRWPASPDRPWQSPDIEIRNARSAADSTWFNVPWSGNPNTIVAQVKNGGNLAAPKVLVNFFVADMNVGGASETFLGSDVKDIGPQKTVEFSCPVPWIPPAEGHYCIIVRIPLYQTPGSPSVAEMTELNNSAQSNYDRFISATASPPSREITEVTVGNPYNLPTRVYFTVGNTNPLYRTYISNKWLWLNPKETRKITTMFEFAPDHMKGTAYLSHPDKLEGYIPVPNNVNFTSFIQDPRFLPKHIWNLFSGSQIQVVTGRATRFIEVTVDRTRVRGFIDTQDGHEPVNGGIVIVRMFSSKGDPQGIRYEKAPVKNGRFETKLSGDFDSVDLYFVPPPRYADCMSKIYQVH